MNVKPTSLHTSIQYVHCKTYSASTPDRRTLFDRSFPVDGSHHSRSSSSCRIAYRRYGPSGHLVPASRRVHHVTHTGGERPEDVRVLVPALDFESLSDGPRSLSALQLAAGVQCCGSVEQYPLTGETALHAVGHVPEIVKFVCLVTGTLAGKTVSAATRRVAELSPAERLDIIT